MQLTKISGIRSMAKDLISSPLCLIEIYQVFLWTSIPMKKSLPLKEGFFNIFVLFHKLSPGI